MTRFFYLILAGLLTLPALAQRGDKNGDEQQSAKFKVPPAPVVPPEKAVKTFTLEEGFRIELVAAEPLVNDPVCLVWDGNGRMWVAEMNGYMPDVNGTNENDPVGHIVILEDTDGDGVMDDRKVFLDKLVLPRSLSLVKGGLLWADQSNLYFTPSENDVPGETQLLRKGWTGGGNVEHKPNGLMRALDNRLYSAKSSKCLRWDGSAWIEENIDGRGQWGIAQDNYGRLVTNGNSSNYRGEMLMPGVLRRNPNASVGMPTFSGSNRVWPSRPNTGINRGYRSGMLTEEGKLRSFTAACGLTYYRGDNFPPEYLNNIFTPEPSAHLVKRNIVKEENGKVAGRFAYDDKEFLTCSDERSRIVNAYTGPDGCLYFVDMYRGILQHRTYVTPYLREEILSRGLDKPTGLGRIYRVVHDGKKPGKPPRLLEQSSQELVAHLGHPNGWWRDNAQRLLVDRKDLSVVPALNRMAGEADNHLGQIHALWTLQGMDALNLEAVTKGLKATHPKARATAVRMAEHLGTKEALAALAPVLEDEAYDVQVQLALSLGTFPDGLPMLSGFLQQHNHGFFKDAALTGLHGQEFAFLKFALKEHESMIGKLINTLARSKDPETLSTLGKLAFTGVLEENHRHLIQAALASAALSSKNQAVIEAIMITLDQGIPEKDQGVIIKAMAEKQDKRNVIRLKTVPPVFAKLALSKEPVVQKHFPRFKRIFRFEQAPNYIITPDEKAQFAEGKKEYALLCANCHHLEGTGMINQGPPLVGSEWVLESEERFIALVLNGLTGPIKVAGKKYQPPEILPIMPGIKINPDFTDEKIAAILTYVRNEWDNAAQPVSPKTVAAIRSKLKNNNELFTEKTLKKFR